MQKAIRRNSEPDPGMDWIRSSFALHSTGCRVENFGDRYKLYKTTEWLHEARQNYLVVLYMKNFFKVTRKSHSSYTSHEVNVKWHNRF